MITYGPFYLTFGMCLFDVLNPTFILRQAGGLKQLRDHQIADDIQVLILGGNDPCHVTRAQRRSVQQICRAILQVAPGIEIRFCMGTSPHGRRIFFRARISPIRCTP